MKHELKKLLSDRNPDGSITYTSTDLEIITQEYNDEQFILKKLTEKAYDELISDLKTRMAGVAEFAYSDEKDAVAFGVGSNLDLANQSWNHFFRVIVDLWGEKLNEKPLYNKGEKVGEWICSEASTHRFEFILFTTEEVWRQVTSL